VIPDPIPPHVDIEQMIADLGSWGWRDYKIEVRCGLGKGYIAQIRCGNVKAPAYDKAARIFNFWRDELAEHVSRANLQTRHEEGTTA